MGRRQRGEAGQFGGRSGTGGSGAACRGGGGAGRAVSASAGGGGAHCGEGGEGRGVSVAQSGSVRCWEDIRLRNDAGAGEAMKKACRRQVRGGAHRRRRCRYRGREGSRILSRFRRLFCAETAAHRCSCSKALRSGQRWRARRAACSRSRLEVGTFRAWHPRAQWRVCRTPRCRTSLAEQVHAPRACQRPPSPLFCSFRLPFSFCCALDGRTGPKSHSVMQPTARVTM